MLILIFNLSFIIRWESGKSNLVNKNLPANMQYLVTKGVPCEKRIKDMNKFQQEFADDLEKDAEDGWVETANPESLKHGDKEEIMDLDNLGDDGKI